MMTVVQRQYSLYGYVDSRDLEFFKKDFQHFSFVLGGVHIGFSEEDWAFVGCNFEQGEGMFPQKFHVVPVFDDPMGERVLEFVESSFVAGEFVANICFELIGSIGDHHLIFGSSDAASANLYTEGKTKGRFSSPLKPTFIKPLP